MAKKKNYTLDAFYKAASNKGWSDSKTEKVLTLMKTQGRIIEDIPTSSANLFTTVPEEIPTVTDTIVEDTTALPTTLPTVGNVLSEENAVTIKEDIGTELFNALFPNTAQGGGYILNPLVDVSTLPARFVAAAFGGEKMSDPDAIFGKRVIQKIDNPILRGAVSGAAQVAFDPLSFVGPAKVALESGPAISKLITSAVDKSPKVSKALGKLGDINKQGRENIIELGNIVTRDLGTKLKRGGISLSMGDLTAANAKKILGGSTNTTEAKNKLIDLLIEKNLVPKNYSADKLNIIVQEAIESASAKMTEIFNKTGAKVLVDKDAPISAVNREIVNYDIPGLIGREDLATKHLDKIKQSQDAFLDVKQRSQTLEDLARKAVVSGDNADEVVKGVLDGFTDVGKGFMAQQVDRINKPLTEANKVTVDVANKFKQALSHKLFKKGANISDDVIKDIVQEKVYLNYRDDIAKALEKSGIPGVKEAGQEVHKLINVGEVTQNLANKDKSFLAKARGIDFTRPGSFTSLLSNVPAKVGQLPVTTSLIDLLYAVPKGARAVRSGRDTQPDVLEYTPIKYTSETPINVLDNTRVQDTLKRALNNIQ